MKVALLERKISELKGSDYIAQTINTPLEANIGQGQEQYSRRLYLVISVLAEPGHRDEFQKVATTIEDKTGIACNIVIRNIDKGHPIKHVDENWKQKRIVKFTLDSFKEAIYRKRKEKQRKHVPSSNERISLLESVSSSNHQTEEEATRII